MISIALPLPPLGIKIFTRTPRWATQLPAFHGASFCLAVHEATTSGPLWLAPGTIEVCRWSPAVLGFVEPTSDFQKDLQPRLPPGTAGLVLAPVDRFPAQAEPDVVLVRAGLPTLREMAERIGWEHAAWEHVEDKRIAKSALRQIRETEPSWRQRGAQISNRLLAELAKLARWQRTTFVAFRSPKVSAGMEAIIKRTQASMSMCRNSLVIPFQTERFNISYFCAGGITWGGNEAGNLTSGWPWPLWRRLASQLVWRDERQQ